MFALILTLALVGSLAFIAGLVFVALKIDDAWMRRHYVPGRGGRSGRGTGYSTWMGGVL